MRKSYSQASASGQINISEEEYLGVKNKELPALSKMAGNAARAALAAAKSGFKAISVGEQKRRYGICVDDCGFYRPQDGRCAMCGCWVKAKVKIEAWHCPIDRW